MYKKPAKTPPLGWNSWDCFGAAVTEEQLKANADYMAKYLKPYGWEYIVCDIQWYEPTAGSNDYHPFAPLVLDGYGRLLPAENRFPSAAGDRGFAPIATVWGSNSVSTFCAASRARRCIRHCP